MPTRPNLLFLYTDEQRFDTLACYGNERIEMPNLNRFAETATVFDQAYVTQPVCTPSRSSLLTGLYPHSNGMTENNKTLDDATPCIPEMLPAGVYATAHHGKWHLGNEIFAQHGFQEFISIDDGYRGYYTEGHDKEARSTYDRWLRAKGLTPENGSHFGRGEVCRLPEEHSKPAYLAEEACAFLERNRANPFCLFVNFFEPHMPFFGPRDEQYAPEDLPPPIVFAAPEGQRGAPEHLKHAVLRAGYRKRQMDGLDLSTDEGWMRIRANYWGLCSQVDTYAGRILDRLEALGLDDNTIVVYTSDHGDMMGDHRLLAKCTMYESSSRVPLLVRMPGQREQRRVAGPVSQIDLAPTILEAMDVTPPTHLQGESLLTEVEQGGAVARDVFIEWNGPNNGFGDKLGGVTLPEDLEGVAEPEAVRAAITDPIRTVVRPDGWKLNYSPMGWHELFHLTDDPEERHNRAADPDCQAVATDATARIRVWGERTGDAPAATAAWTPPSA